MVVANAVAALSEINEASQSGQPLVGEFFFVFISFGGKVFLVFCTVGKERISEGTGNKEI